MTSHRSILLPWSTDEFVEPDAALLGQRATYGLTEDVLKDINRVGVRGWLDEQLNSVSILGGPSEDVSARFPAMSWTVSQARNALGSGEVGPNDIGDAYPIHALGQAIWAPGQLREKMASFWDEFFAVPYTDQVADSRAHLDGILREQSLGRFRDLLREVTLHPATLTLYGTSTTKAQEPSLVHARELLEQHSLGQVLDEETLETVGRLLTGYRIAPTPGEMYTEASYRWIGVTSFLGFHASASTAKQSFAVTDAMFTYLAMHSRTARRICSALVRTFISEEDHSGLINRMIETYKANKTAIGPVLKVMFLSREFSDSQGQLTRRPLEGLIAAARVLDLSLPARGTTGLRQLYSQSVAMGQPCRSLPPADADFTGAGAVAARMAAYLNLAHGWWPDALVYPQWRSYLPQELPETFGDVADALVDRLTHQSATTSARQSLCAAVSREPSSAVVDAELPEAVARMIGAILSSDWHGRI